MSESINLRYTEITGAKQSEKLGLKKIPESSIIKELSHGFGNIRNRDVSSGAQLTKNGPDSVPLTGVPGQPPAPEPQQLSTRSHAF